MTPTEKILKASLDLSHFAPNKTTKTLSEQERQTIVDLTDSVRQSLSGLNELLDKRDFRTFYEWLSSLKFFIEYSDELNKNWYLVRAYAGALQKLSKEETLENADAVFQYYELKYGGRRILRHENSFEHQRWDFLDELQQIDSLQVLSKFIEKRFKKLREYFQVFQSEVQLFLQDLNSQD